MPWAIEMYACIWPNCGRASARDAAKRNCRSFVALVLEFRLGRKSVKLWL